MSFNINNFRVLVWTGAADGTTPLNPAFDLDELKGRNIKIKRIKVDTYAGGDTVQFAMASAFAGWTAALTNLVIVKDGFKLFPQAVEASSNGIKLDININGMPVGLFGLTGYKGVNYDADFDNLDLDVQEVIQSIEIKALSRYLQDYSNVGSAYLTPAVKITMEIYFQNKPAER